MTACSKTLLASRVTYYSALDEDALFQWLDRIACVGGYEGRGVNLIITLARNPDDNELREFVALFYRYDVEMRQLEQFSDGEDRAWFRSPEMFWHHAVFGSTPNGR